MIWIIGNLRIAVERDGIDEYLSRLAEADGRREGLEFRQDTK